MRKNYLADLRRAYLGDYRILKLSLDRRRNSLCIHRALLTGSFNNEHKLVFIKKFLTTVALYHRDRNGIDDLVGREALAAGGAFATALDA